MVKDHTTSFKLLYDEQAAQGKKNMFNGEVSEHSVVFYGTPIVRLVKDENGEWSIWQGAVFPDFQKVPELLDDEEFSKKMKELGVSDELLEKYFNFEPSFDNF